MSGRPAGPHAGPPEADGPALGEVTFGIGWDVRSTATTLDLDLAVFVLGASGRVLSDEHFVFFNNLVTPGSAVRLQQTPRPSGVRPPRTWAESVSIDLDALGPEVEGVAVAVASYGGEGTFRDFSGAFIEVTDSRCGPLADFDLAGRRHATRALVYADLRRDGGVWRFRALGRDFAGLMEIAVEFGVDV